MSVIIWTVVEIVIIVTVVAAVYGYRDIFGENKLNINDFIGRRPLDLLFRCWEFYGNETIDLGNKTIPDLCRLLSQ